MGPWILLAASSTVTLLSMSCLFVLVLYEPTGTVMRWLRPGGRRTRILSMEDLQTTIITDRKAMERVWTVRHGKGEMVAVQGANWFVALGRGLRQLGRDDDMVRLACETLPNGTGLARDIASGVQYVVELAEPSDDTLVAADADVEVEDEFFGDGEEPEPVEVMAEEFEDENEDDDDIPTEDVDMEPLDGEAAMWPSSAPCIRAGSSNGGLA